MSLSPHPLTPNGTLHLAQRDGTPPATLATGGAPGESGVSVLRARFRGSAHFSAIPRQHFVCFQLSPKVQFRCRMAGQTLRHDAAAGSLAVLPAGIDGVADADESVDALLVAIDPGQLALAAAEELVPGAQLMERLSGEDRALLHLARTLAVESARRYPEGALFWNDVASRFVMELLARHTSKPQGPRRGRLGGDVLGRIRDHVLDHIDGPIEVTALADIAARSPFHFSRVFTQSVGMTPHRYVVHLRLRRATQLIRDGALSLAEIAARTGFADQSHLSRWIRRVHGVPPTRFAATEQNSRNLHDQTLASSHVSDRGP